MRRTLKRYKYRIAAMSIAFAAFIIIVSGLRTDRDFTGYVKVEINAPREKVWAMLNDIVGMPRRNPSIRSIEILDAGKNYTWRERLNFGQQVTFALTAFKPMERVQWTMLESSYGMNGTWTYDLKAIGEKTEVTLSETSYCHKFMTRAALGIVGHDAIIVRLLSDLEASLK